MADSEKMSSLPLERERFEAWWNEVESFATRGERLSCGTPEEVARDAWYVASAGRQELLDCLKRIARAQPDRLDHAIDVSIIERAARIAAEAIAKHGG